MKHLALAVSIFALSFAAYAQAPTCLAGATGGALTASLAFKPPAANTDGTPLAYPLTYNLYQSTASGAEVKVLSGIKGAPLAVTIGLTPKTTYYWQMSVVDANGVEGPLSIEACKTFPGSVPGMIVITIT